MDELVSLRELEHYFRFVLRDESGPLRERIFDALVAGALRTANRPNAISEDTLLERLSQLSGLRQAFPRDLVVSALARLEARGDVLSEESSSGKTLYRLSSFRNDALRASDRSDPIEDAAIKAVVQRVTRIAGPLQRVDKKLIGDGFRRFVTGILASQGEQCAQCLLSERRLAGTPNQSVPELLAQSVAGLPDGLHETVSAVFMTTLREPEEVDAAYLYVVGQAYYMVALLHLDPELQVLEHRRFEDTTLFLDTNILVAAVVKKHREHAAVVGLLSHCQSLGFQLAFSEATAQEWDYLLAAADREIEEYPPVDTAAAALLANLADNPFLEGYLKSWSEHHLNWTQFRVGLASRDAALASLGVSPTTGLELATSGARFDQLRDELQRDPVDGRSGRRPNAARHDAALVVLVEDLVKKDARAAHPFGNRFWIISLDRRLRGLVRRLPDSSTGCVCLLAHEWLLYISPFVSPEMAGRDLADVYSGLLSSRLFLSVGESLTMADLQPFTAPGVSELLHGLDPEAACRFVVAARMDAATTDAPRRDPAAIDALAAPRAGPH